MLPSNENKVRLEVQTGDVASEIFVIDGQFKLAARGIGARETFMLAPGIYTVKVRTGSQSREAHAILSPGEVKPVIKKFPAISFSSPVPLSNTERANKSHIEAAHRESSKVHVEAGQGSSIFIFARDWQPQRSDGKSSLAQQPQRGLILKSEQGETIADLATASVGETKKGADPWAACNVKVKPGTYRLCLNLDEGTIEQTIVASPEWQTQIFLLQRNYGTGAETRYADLNNSAILLSKGGFDPDSRQLRLVELSRLGLINSRQVLSNSVINEILHGKFTNPMLGIYGAYLLLDRTQSTASSQTKDVASEKSAGPELLNIVVQNLRRLLGEEKHPDVEALALQLEEKESSYIFEMPPMLRRSWWKIIETTVQRPELVPADSLAAQAAEQLWGEEPWLLWMTRTAHASGSQKRDIEEAEPAPDPSDLEIVLQAQMRQRARTSTDSAPPKQAATRGIFKTVMIKPDAQASDEEEAETKGAGMGFLEHDAAILKMPSEDTLENVSFSSSEEVAGEALDEVKVSRLVRMLGVPRSTLEKRLRESALAKPIDNE